MLLRSDAPLTLPPDPNPDPEAGSVLARSRSRRPGLRLGGATRSACRRGLPGLISGLGLRLPARSREDARRGGDGLAMRAGGCRARRLALRPNWPPPSPAHNALLCFKIYISLYVRAGKGKLQLLRACFSITHDRSTQRLYLTCTTAACVLPCMLQIRC